MEKPSKNDNNPFFYISGLRHDIRNQLSNIQLSLEELRHEMSDESADIKFYLDTIAASCEKINHLLKDKEE
jgi:hypothetical protein